MDLKNAAENAAIYGYVRVSSRDQAVAKACSMPLSSFRYSAGIYEKSIDEL